VTSAKENKNIYLNVSADSDVKQINKKKLVVTKHYKKKKNQRDSLAKACSGTSLVLIKCALLDTLCQIFLFTTSSSLLSFISNKEIMTYFDNCVIGSCDFVKSFRNLIHEKNLPACKVARSIRLFKRNIKDFNDCVLFDHNNKNNNNNKHSLQYLVLFEFLNKPALQWNFNELCRFVKLESFRNKIHDSGPIIPNTVLTSIVSKEITGNCFLEYSISELLLLAENNKSIFVSLQRIKHDIYLLYGISAVKSNNQNNSTFIDTDSFESDDNHNNIDTDVDVFLNEESNEKITNSIDDGKDESINETNQVKHENNYNENNTVNQLKNNDHDNVILLKNLDLLTVAGLRRIA